MTKKITTSSERAETVKALPDERHRDALDVLERAVGPVHDVVVHKTWGSTQVIEAVSENGESAFVLKASGAHDVFAEVAAAELARDAGLPVPRILHRGRARTLPGGRWFVAERATGRSWASLGGLGIDLSLLLQDLAAHLKRLHAVRRSGYGWLDRDGAGTFASWRAWLEHVVDRDMGVLNEAGLDTARLNGHFERALDELTEVLDDRPSALVHGDLGDREVIVDPASLHVTAIVDWGDALIGDPVYEFARFVAGGPPGDTRPNRFRPKLQEMYGYRPDDATERLQAFYDAHNALRNAAWSVREEPSWVAGLIDVATTRLEGIEHE
jgi:aminoglycoside phosphotransferase (APT) family kinase protein